MKALVPAAGRSYDVATYVATGVLMKFATVRDLKNRTSEMLRHAAAGRDVLITSHGRPVAILHGMKQEDLEDWVLSHDPALRESIEAADREYLKKGGVPVEEVIQALKNRLRGRKASIRWPKPRLNTPRRPSKI